MKPQATRVRYRRSPWLELIAMTAAAALVAFGVWLAFAVLTSLGSYIPTLP